MNVQQKSTIFKPGDVSGTEDAIVDAEQTTSDESESPVKETTEKSDKMNSFSSNWLQLGKFMNVYQLIFMQSKTILSWEHVIDKIKISNNSDHDVSITTL